MQCLARILQHSSLMIRSPNLFNNAVKIIPSISTQEKSFHSVSECTGNKSVTLLKVLSPQMVFSHGMKVKGVVRRRCDDCVMFWRKGVLHNMCKTKPRHNHRSITPREKDTWILTFSSVKPKRDW